MGFIRNGREVTGALSGGTEILDKGAGTEVGLRCGEDVVELAEDVAQVVDHRW